MARKKQMEIQLRDGVEVLDIGEMEIWDGADLSFLRDTLHILIVKEGSSSLGVNMRFVKYVPSGFFGMLYDCHEKGTSIRVYEPQAHVQKMLWFQQFFDHVYDDCHLLVNGPKHPLNINGSSIWNNRSPWNSEKPTQLAATMNATARTHLEDNRVIVK